MVLIKVGVPVLLYCASYYPRRGGFSYPEGYSGDFCGNFTVNMDRAYSINGWHTGAALELLHIIMLIVAVILTLVTVVDLSVIMLQLVLLMALGVLELLYYSYRLCLS